MIYNTFDVVEVPFPFSDLPKAKVRKALVITPKAMNENNRATTLMMITSRKNSAWVGDINLQEWQKAGLNKPCFVRFKFFTADNQLLRGQVGTLAPTDQLAVKNNLRNLIG